MRFLMLVLLLCSTNVFAEAITLNINPPQPKAIVLDVPESFVGENNNIWIRYGQALREMDIQQWTFKVTGYGGNVLDANRFIKEVVSAQQNGKKIIMDIVGPAYSAHAIITCYADTLIVEPGASLMFHSMSYDKSYLFGLIEYNSSELDPSSQVLQDNLLSHCVSVGLLTTQDVKYLQTDGDIVISYKDDKMVKVYSKDPDRLTKLFKDIGSIIATTLGFLAIVFLVKRV